MVCKLKYNKPEIDFIPYDTDVILGSETNYIFGKEFDAIGEYDGIWN